jgi:hypothetical protein
LKGEITVNWYRDIACFFAGMFLANFVPHFVQGVSGNRFPTPFAKPPGQGLSSSTVNVVWALFNLVVGYLLFRAGKVSSGDVASLVIFFAGIAAISVMMSVRFADKHAS